MSETHIEKLVLKLSGLDELQGKRLAEQVATQLEGVSWPGNLPVRVELVRIKIKAAQGASIQRLAQQVTTELVQGVQESRKNYAG
jgi:hypothetical protein